MMDWRGGRREERVALNTPPGGVHDDWKGNRASAASFMLREKERVRSTGWEVVGIHQKWKARSSSTR